MKSISTGLANALAAETTTLATCWKLTRRDGEVMGFTDHDRPLTFEGVEYAARTGFSPTAVTASSALNVDNLDVEGMLEDESITAEDVMAGRYDFAEIEVFQMNYLAPEQGKMTLRRGWLGEITLWQGRFVAEVRGLSQKLSQNVGALYSVACRAELGDSRCKVVMGAYTHTGTVTDGGGRHGFTDSARSQGDGYFTGGKVTFTSGLNNGLSIEIKEYSAKNFVFTLPLPHPVAIGDTYSAQAGCDKNFDTCRLRFNNAVNFRGEPHVPGLDRMLETAATRTLR